MNSEQVRYILRQYRSLKSMKETHEFRYCVARLHRQLQSIQQEQRLDRYLLAFFQTVDKQNAAFTQGFEVEASRGALRGMLRLTLNAPSYQSEHPFFPVARRYMDTHPCPAGQDAVAYHFLKLSTPLRNTS